MDQQPILDEWRVVEADFSPHRQRVYESLFSLGNGSQGHRGHFEEDYSGPSLPGAYLGGIYYPDAVPRWYRRQGLPETYAKMPNAANWFGVHVAVDGEILDLAHARVLAYRRSLDLRRGLLHRTCTVELSGEKKLELEAIRFQSMADPEIGALVYRLRPLNFSATFTLIPYIDGNVANEEALGDEGFWVEVDTQVRRTHAHLLVETRKSAFQVGSSMKFLLWLDDEPIEPRAFRIQREKYVAGSLDFGLHEGSRVELQKFCANLSTLHHPREGMLDRGKDRVKAAAQAGWDALRKEHIQAWARLWEQADVEILGDPAAQQGMRFSIFHLLQAYQGRDERLSISPKGYTGERYGGCTLWTAESFCLPFVMGVLGQEAARKLLLYRYHHLPAAQANARRLGMDGGAALFPLMTLDGAEGHPDWELAFSAVHRNGAIALAIAEYLGYTGDPDFLIDFGLEMLIAIARYWTQRVHFSRRREAYLIHGVTGPNEYGGVVDNNWCTNLLAAWCLRYAADSVEMARSSHPDAFQALGERLQFKAEKELHQWKLIATRIHLPYDRELGLFPEHETYLDKKLTGVMALDAAERPLYRHWSLDRIRRSGYIQRADVLQGLLYFYRDFSREEVQRNFAFYEAQTVHESSLSYGVHALLAARLGLTDKAYGYFLRSARLDLDNLSGETGHGCHITAMGATWMALVRGFGGMDLADDRLVLNPSIPIHWQQYTFRVCFRQWRLQVVVSPGQVRISHDQEVPLPLTLCGQQLEVPAGKGLTFKK